MFFLPLSIFESSGSMQYCHKNPQDIWIYVSMRHMVYRPLNVVAEAEENIKKKIRMRMCRPENKEVWYKRPKRKREGSVKVNKKVAKQ